MNRNNFFTVCIIENNKNTNLKNWGDWSQVIFLTNLKTSSHCFQIFFILPLKSNNVTIDKKRNTYFLKNKAAFGPFKKDVEWIEIILASVAHLGDGRGESVFWHFNFFNTYMSVSQKLNYFMKTITYAEVTYIYYLMGACL